MYSTKESSEVSTSHDCGRGQCSIWKPVVQDGQGHRILSLREGVALVRTFGDLLHNGSAKLKVEDLTGPIPESAEQKTRERVDKQMGSWFDREQQSLIATREPVAFGQDIYKPASPTERFNSAPNANCNIVQAALGNRTPSGHVTQRQPDAPQATAHPEVHVRALATKGAEEGPPGGPSRGYGRENPLRTRPSFTHHPGSRGIEGAPLVKTIDFRSCKCPSPNDLERFKSLSLAEAEMCYHDTPASKEMDMRCCSGDRSEVPVMVRKALARRTCEYVTRQLICQYVPAAEDDPILFRWCVYVLWTTWTDQTTHRRVIHHKILDWIGHQRFDTGKAVLAYIKDRLPDMEHSTTWAPGQHTRQIIRDGLPAELWKAIDEDLSTPPSQYQDRVYVLSGDPVGRQDATDIRKEIEEEISELEPPSGTSGRIWNYMNEVPAKRFDRFDDRIEKAIEHVDRMGIDVDVSPKEAGLLRYFSGCEKTDDGELKGDMTRYKAMLRHEKRKLAHQQRAQYKMILHQIALQHKPYYGFSRQERTDRIFGHNPSVLRLPTEVREILCEGLYDVDLKSAHLLIAAWLWDAEEALETLTQEGYSIWDDLMEHCRPLFEKQGLSVPAKGEDLFAEVKAGMKIMVYSTVYGMPASSIQTNVTKALKPILGPDVGKYLKSHPILQQLIKARDEKLSALEPGDCLEAPTGIDIEVEVSLEQEKDDDCHKAGPRSAMATYAQSFEQELMSVLLDVASERTEFRPLLWLHDGAECAARRPNGLEKTVNERLTTKQKELTKFAGKDRLLPAIFEVQKIEAPEMPPSGAQDRVASAGGGAVRLKEGEQAVKVDPQTGEETAVPNGTGPAGPTLLAHEHELYRIADTYIRVTGGGYATAQDPYPEDKLWNNTKTNETNSTSSTSSNETTETEKQSPSAPTSTTSRTGTAPGAENPLKEERKSRDSDTSTESAPERSPDLDPVVQRRLDRRKRIREGDVPPVLPEAKAEGFSYHEWKAVYSP